MSYFYSCKTVEEIKKVFRKLSRDLHPDQGGDHDKFIELQSEYEQKLEAVLFDAYDLSDKKDKPNFDSLYSVLLAACRLNCRVEIIGFWIFAFDSYEDRDELKNAGFWFSGKRKAWIYSGGQKRRGRGHYSTEQLREKWSVEVVQERGEARQLVPA